MHKKIIVFFIVFISCTLSASAQCAMCRAALETEETGVPAEAINDGIIYLMVFPYLLFVLVGFGVYRMMKNNKSQDE